MVVVVVWVVFWQIATTVGYNDDEEDDEPLKAVAPLQPVLSVVEERTQRFRAGSLTRYPCPPKLEPEKARAKPMLEFPKFETTERTSTSIRTVVREKVSESKPRATARFCCACRRRG